MKEKIEEAILTCVPLTHYSTQTKKESWGYSVKLTEINNNGHASFYLYNDDPETIYLCNLRVRHSARNQGLGTEFQRLRENIGRELGFTKSCLASKKDLWMAEWYKRRGYEEFEDNEVENEKEMILMQKQLQ